MKTLAVVLVALLVSVISLSGWMLAQPNPLNGEIAKLEKELHDARGEIAKLKADLTTQQKEATARSLAQTAAATVPTGEPGADVPANDGKTPPAAGAAAKGTGMKGMMSEVRKMMENPGMKEVIRQQNLAQMDMRYGRLFESFQLNPEEKENFKQLLSARLAAETDMGLKMMDENLTPDQKKQIAADLTTAMKASDEAIKTFLGNDEDYKTFQHWEDTQPERLQFDMLGGRSYFSAAGEPLSPDQEQKLIDVMAAIRKSPDKLPDLSKPENFSLENITDEMIQQQLQKADRDAQTVAQNAAGFLSTTQLQSLAKMQQQMRTMTEASLKMSGAMLKGGK
jgi:hypothetical protein